MQRLGDHFLDEVDAAISLAGKRVLEIGCGIGNKSVALANKCAELVAIDPAAEAIAVAKRDFAAPNLVYAVGSAQLLDFGDASFDLAIFSLSLHHVPISEMANALRGAARVVKPSGRVVVLEPEFIGTFFDAEVQFGASDGDERREKAAAHLALLSAKELHQEAEWYDEIIFKFDSYQDFARALGPKTNLAQAKVFLKTNNNSLSASRRVNVFSVASGPKSSV